MVGSVIVMLGRVLSPLPPLLLLLELELELELPPLPPPPEEELSETSLPVLHAVSMEKLKAIRREAIIRIRCFVVIVIGG